MKLERGRGNSFFEIESFFPPAFTSEARNFIYRFRAVIRALRAYQRARRRKGSSRVIHLRVLFEARRAPYVKCIIRASMNLMRRIIN